MRSSGTSMEIEPRRGGFRGPVRTTEFILQYLSNNGEAYIAEMHRAYKQELLKVAEQDPRRCRVTRSGEIKVRSYHAPRYHSFEMRVQVLARQGLIEFCGREEESDSPQFQGWDAKPLRRFYRLVQG